MAVAVSCVFTLPCMSFVSIKYKTAFSLAVANSRILNCCRIYIRLYPCGLLVFLLLFESTGVCRVCGCMHISS
jgi:hypothetical protein